MHSTTQCHALVLGTTGTTYIRQQQKYIGREKYEINKNKNKNKGVAEAGSVRASQWLRREHTAYEIHGHPLAGPGCLVEPKHQETRTRNVSSWLD